jgi:hypothetical protein
MQLATFSRKKNQLEFVFSQIPYALTFCSKNKNTIALDHKVRNLFKYSIRLFKKKIVIKMHEL